MGKLHELLAVEGDLKAEAQRTASRSKSLFADGQGKLVGQTRHYSPLEEGGETWADEITEMATTVEDELGLFGSAFAAWVDAAMQKERTNQDASADVELDGQILFASMPATALLNLESKLAEIRHVYAAIPTNDPTESWQWDEQKGCFVSRPRTTYKTKKMMRSHVAHEATPEHPAQVQTYTEDVRIGAWETIIHSGMLTPTDKRLRLERIDELLRAVKQARQRANNIDVVSVHVGQTIFDYINGE